MGQIGSQEFAYGSRIGDDSLAAPFGHLGLPRRAPGVRLGGELRISVTSFCASFESFNRRKYVRSPMPSRGLAMVFSPLDQRLLSFLFLKRNTLF